MAAWWADLSSLNQFFYVLAVFFSVIFGWQFLSSLGGLGDHVGADHAAGGHDAAHFGGGDHAAGGHDAAHFGGDHAATGHDAVGHDAAHAGGAHTTDGHTADQHETQHDSDSVATFRLLSIRSVLAFGTLFSWAGALYLQRSLFPGLALLRATLWGLAGMVIVALFFWILPRLSEAGTADLDTAVGQTAQVYLDIPEGGAGQVRVRVSGAVSFVRARSRDGRYLPSGTGVRVIRRLDGSTLEVEPLEV